MLEEYSANPEAELLEEDSMGEEETDENSRVLTERAVKEVTRIMNSGIYLPTATAHYKLSDRVDLTITSEQYGDIALVFVRGGNVFSIGFNTWQDLYPRIRQIHSAVMKRFKNVLSKIDNDARNGHDFVQLSSGQMIRVRFMNEDVQVQFCDKSLVSLFQLMLNEWRQLYQNIFDINILVQNKWFNYMTKQSVY